MRTILFAMVAGFQLLGLVVVGAIKMDRWMAIRVFVMIVIVAKYDFIT